MSGFVTDKPDKIIVLRSGNPKGHKEIEETFEIYNGDYFEVFAYLGRTSSYQYSEQVAKWLEDPSRNLVMPCGPFSQDIWTIETP